MNQDLSGLSIALTGATDGIGRLAVGELSRLGAHVWVHGRDAAKVRGVVQALRDDGGAADGVVADFSSLSATRRLADELREKAPELDVLVNNAGIGFGPDQSRRELSRDGFELRLAVNYLAPYLLTTELLRHGLPRRALVNVASIGQEPLDFDDLMTEQGYTGIRAYRRSKLALVMLSFDLADAHADRVVTVIHPGTLLDTKMVREVDIAPHGPAETGRDAIVSAVTRALGGEKSGQYYDVQTPAKANAAAYDREARVRLARRTEELVVPFRASA